MLSFEQALNIVKEKLAAADLTLGAEVVPLAEARTRVLAEDVVADRDYPPFHRSIRDGFAVRAEDIAAPPVELLARGEIRAGGHFTGSIRAGECVSIMTGAPLPAGADAVVMVEYTELHDDRVTIQRGVRAGENVVPQGSEVHAGTCVMPRGRRLGAGELGLLATVGKSQVPVFARPSVAILPTGDEVVPVEQQPEWFQIRNSNAVSLSAQVTAAGGNPHCFAIAPDRPEALRSLIQKGLKTDLLLLTGGVSVGKYDFVEQVLAGLGAEFYFQSVALRPGKPLVFGRVAGKFFFGLPGNPVSTFVTFALFARPALAVLGGAKFEQPLFLRARLGKPFKQPSGLTAFLPARVEASSGEPVVNSVGWQGSGDLVGVAAANCFIVIHPEQAELAAGDSVDVMAKD
ncbi:MAG: molybdopterin molybdotransferase MoeA [Acidobacteriota bacterium]|nr:molybdopterin molybdotransferase MoeA [Acidobacteriota bacterium]